MYKCIFCNSLKFAASRQKTRNSDGDFIILYATIYLYIRGILYRVPCTSPIRRRVCEIYLTKCICKSHNARQSSNVTVMCIHYTCSPRWHISNNASFYDNFALYISWCFTLQPQFSFYGTNLNYKWINYYKTYVAGNETMARKIETTITDKEEIMKKLK